MKTFGKYAVVALAVTLAACGAEKATEEKAVAPVLETEIQKQSYALGAQLGDFIDKNIKENASIGIQLDKEIVLTGLQDALAGNPHFSEEDVRVHLTALEQSVREKRDADAKALEDVAKKEGQDYLVENAKKEGVVTTESGLQYEVMSEGEGAMPVATDVVKVHYVGTLLNGEEFDSSVARGEPAEFPLNRVIKGWTEGVQLMKEGAKYKFTIPSELAYGPRAAGKIPAHSTLVFEVELLEIVKAEEAPATDAAAAK